MNRNKTETKLGCLLILSPFILAVVGMLVFWGWYKHINIVTNSSKYEMGIFILNRLECDKNTYGASTGACRAYGNVAGIKTKIGLGAYRKEVYKENPTGTQYPVFYRHDGKFTIRRDEHVTEFNTTPYIFKAVGFTVVPVVSLLLLICYYYRLRKKLKETIKK